MAGIHTQLYLFWLPEIAFTALFIRAGYPYPTKKAFWLKMCASTLFLLHGLAAYILTPAQGAFGRWVAAGLALGWFGDIFLTLHPFLPPHTSARTRALVTLPGGIAFFFGHAAYVIACTRLFGAQAFSLPVFAGVWLALMALPAALHAVLRVQLGRYAAPIVVYALGITAMAAYACCIAVRGYSDAGRALLIAAPLLFVVSDSTLGLRTFTKDRFHSIGVRTVCLGAYYAAQMLFGLSILYLQ